MSNSGLKNTVVRVLKYQITQGLGVVLVAMLIKHDLNALFSALFGLLLALIPTVVYASVVISKQIDSVSNMYRKHKKAMVLKFLSNALGFALVFTLVKHIDVFLLFLAYIVTLSGYWTSLPGLVKVK